MTIRFRHPITAEVLPLRRRLSRAGLAVQLFHRFQERVRGPHARRQLSNAIARFRPKPADTDTPDIAALNEDGIMMMPGFLQPDQAAKLVEVLSGMACQDPWKPEKGQFRIENAPPGTHVADIPDAATLKAASEIAFDRRLLAMAGVYFGSVPYVDSIQAWWSLSGNTVAQEAENFHRDNDGIRFLKFFLYLTDVDIEQGPHNFVRGSHVDPRLLERRRYTDEEVKSCFGNNCVFAITGKAGDAFLEDTFGIHKGQLPTAGRRLLLQVRYAITPTIFRSRIIVDALPPVGQDQTISLIHGGRPKR